MSNRIALCPADALAVGEMRRVEAPGYDPLLLINDAGTYRLIEDDCTHAIASLSEGRLDGRTIFCPMHGGSFDICTGKAKSLPCKQALRVFPVNVEAGTVWLG